MSLTTTRLLFATFIVLLATSFAQAQGDPHPEATAKVNAFVKSGNEKVRHQDFDGAIADFNEAMKAAKPLPDNVQSAIHMSRAMAQQRKGNLDAALADLNKAIKLQSDNFFAYQNRAVLHEKRKELTEAFADYSKAIRLNSKFPYAYRGRGLILLEQGKDADAEADFAKYLKLNPGGKEALDKQIEEAKQKRAAQP